MDDTEKLNIYNFGDYNFDPQTKEWTCSFYFQVFDNFGLDNGDLLESQGVWSRNGVLFGTQFAAWWVLQHRKGYVPFRTELRFQVSLKGDLDY